MSRFSLSGNEFYQTVSNNRPQTDHKSQRIRLMSTG